MHYSFERDLLNQSNATFTSKTLFSFLRDLSPLAYSCLLTKLKIKYSIRHVFNSSRLGSYFLKKFYGFKAKFKVHAALRGSLARSEADGTPHDYCIALVKIKFAKQIQQIESSKRAAGFSSQGIFQEYLLLQNTYS